MTARGSRDGMDRFPLVAVHQLCEACSDSGRSLAIDETPGVSTERTLQERLFEEPAHDLGETRRTG